MLLSVVIPMYNEREVIAETYRRLTGVLVPIGVDYELIFVNDGSTDGTFDVLMAAAQGDRRLRVIDFARNFGHQMAVRAGLSRAGGDAVVIIDADLQDPPEVIPEMLDKWREGYDVVYGQRISREGEPAFKKWTAFAFYRILRALSGVDIPADTGDFRLIDKKVVQAVLSMKEHAAFLRGMVSWVGFRQCAYPFHRAERFAGQTKYPLKKMVKLAMDGIFSFSTAPVRFLLWAALAMGLSGFLYWLLAVIFAWGSTHVLLSAGMVLTGILLGGMFILGEYIGRIYEEAMNRPLYLIARTVGFEEEPAERQA